MLTRCPNCATTFRVTPEQLKARHGRVRCGQCQRVFDALETLIDAATPAEAAPPQNVGSQAWAEEAAAAPEKSAVWPAVEQESQAPGHAGPAADNIDAPERGGEEPEHGPDSGAAAMPFADPDDAAAAMHDGTAESGAHEPVAAEADTPELAPFAEYQASEPEPAPAAPERISEPDRAPDPDPAPEPKLLPEPALHDPPRRRTWPWALGCLAALLALAAQAVVHYRTELAVLYPAAKPALTALCAPLGCEVSLPRKPELIGIEASDLAPAPEGKLMLSATVRNRAPFAQQYPALELTLTDMGDRPLVRRVLNPTDYLPPRTALAAGLGAGADIALHLIVDAPDIPAVGYQLYLFYP